MRVLRLSLLVTSLLATGVAPAQGAPQSPIVLPLTLPIDPMLPIPVFMHPVNPLPRGVKVKNEGSPHRHLSLKADLTTTTAKVTLETVDYKLQNVHFHKRSEHYLGNQYFPMEMQLVHKMRRDIDRARKVPGGRALDHYGRSGQPNSEGNV